MPKLEYLHLDIVMKILDGIGVEKGKEGGGGEERYLELQELRILIDCDSQITPELIQSVIQDQLAPDLEFPALAILEEDTKERRCDSGTRP